MLPRGDARDAQTDVSRTARGVWYAIDGHETKFGVGGEPAGHYKLVLRLRDASRRDPLKSSTRFI